MSFLSLRLPPARKLWKSFTSTLGKLHKIRRSKAMKKRRKHLNTTSTTTPATITTRRTPKFLASKRFRHKRLATVRSVFNGFHKKPAPVYIDKLFKEPSSEFVGHLKPQAAQKPRNKRIAKIGYRRGELPGTSEDGGGGSEYRPSSSSSDDIWESVAIGSPVMQGIDERAEEFIVRFRQQMAAQETTLARNL